MSVLSRHGAGVVVVLMVLGTLPRHAAADPIAITVGHVETAINVGLARGVLQGDDFRLTFGADGFRASLALDCIPCVSGTTVDMGGAFNLPRAAGSAEVGGVAYPLIYLDGMTAAFTSPSFVISGGSTTIVRQPFSFRGRVSGYLVDPFVHGSTTPEFTRTLFGRGTASATFVFSSDDAGGRVFTATDLRYDFHHVDPVPEPATLLLVGAGLVSAVRARHRHNSARRSMN